MLSHLNRFKLIFFLIAFFMIMPALSPAYADSPPNISANIPWDDDPGTAGDQQTYANVEDIENAFNNARRKEEIDLGLAANVLGTLDLPVQATWDATSDNDKALTIINDERVDRAGFPASVIGLPLTGILNELDDLAQYYADFLMIHNTGGHHADGASPPERIDSWTTIASCNEFMVRSENIATFWSSGIIPMPLERSIYNWIYVDASSSWGHREAALLQDNDLNGNPWGYTNNEGGAADEGYLGIGIANGPHNGWANSYIVVMNIIDPIAADCDPVDYQYDFSDPSISNPNTYGLASHGDSGPYLGSGRTVEDTPLSTGDSNDGIVRTPGAKWTPGGNNGSIDITIGGCAGTCYLTAWIDWNDDGTFDAGAEQILANHAISNGTSSNVTFAVPAAPACYGAANSCKTRFRLYSTSQSFAAPTPGGGASDGEVEDYSWGFSPTSIRLQQTAVSHASSNVWLLVGLIFSLTLVSLRTLKRQNRLF